MIELSVIRDLVAIFGVIAGFSYYVLTVRNTRKAHELQVFEHYGKRASVWSYYNSIGYLLMKGRISIDTVYDLLGLPAVLQWNKWGKIILEIREKQELPQYFKGFEYLVSELKRYQEKHSESVGNR